MEDEDDVLLDAAADATYRKLEQLGGDPAALPSVLQPVAILYTVQAKVDNGGFRYLFENDFPFNPSYAVFSDAYRRIGAENVANLLDRAVALFPFEDPETNQDGRNSFMDSLPESHELFLLGDMVCGDKPIWGLMAQYVKANRKAFNI